MKFLIEYKADCHQAYNVQNECPLTVAIDNDDIKILETLLENKANPNYRSCQDPETALIKCCYLINRDDHFQLLIDYNADIYIDITSDYATYNTLKNVFDYCDEYTTFNNDDKLKSSLYNEDDRRRNEILTILTAGVYDTEDPNKVVRTMLPLPIPGGHIQLYEMIVNYVL
jgi:ankyrin repeat protein